MAEYEIMKREIHPRYIVKKIGWTTYEKRFWTLWGARSWIRRYKKRTMYTRVGTD